MVGMVLIFIVGKVGVDRKYFSQQTKYFCCVQAVSWRVLAGFCCVFPLLSSVLLLLIPESPSWLVTQGRQCRHHQPRHQHRPPHAPGRLVEARRALQWLRGRDYDIEQEFSRLTRSYEVTQQDRSDKQDLARCAIESYRQL